MKDPAEHNGPHTSLFDYPLAVPQATLYAHLGLPPGADDEDIRLARNEAKSRLDREQKAVEARLDAACHSAPGYREDLKKLEAMRIDEDADPKARRILEKKVADQEKRASEKDPEFPVLQERATDLRYAIEENNRMALANPESRAKYDRAHPPLGLLRMEDCTSDQFVADRALLLPLLRRELVSFLAQQGEPVLHVTDLERTEFTADFVPNDMLDGGDDGEE